MLLVEKTGKKQVYADWNQWNAKSYLSTYFDKLGQDSIENLDFLIKELNRLKNSPKQKILDFGSGPTIFSGLVAAPYASEIHMADYLDVNLIEIRKWLEGADDAFDWNNCLEVILKMEGKEANSNTMIERVKDLKSKTTQLLHCDASKKFPLGKIHQYPIVISNFCADSATSSKKIWKIFMRNKISTVAPNGVLILAALRNCRYYRSGNEIFPSANINEDDMYNLLLEEGFDDDKILIEVREVPQCKDEGFSSIICVRAVKNKFPIQNFNGFYEKIAATKVID